MEPETNELKELMRQNIALAQDTNKTLHAMRRSARVRGFFSIAWWVLVFALSGAAYYYYLQPYVQKIEDAYAKAQTGAQQAQTWETQAADFFKGFFGGQ
jgi:hypothetical protein